MTNEEKIKELRDNHGIAIVAHKATALGFFLGWSCHINEDINAKGIMSEIWGIVAYGKETKEEAEEEGIKHAEMIIKKRTMTVSAELPSYDEEAKKTIKMFEECHKINNKLNELRHKRDTPGE